MFGDWNKEIKFHNLLEVWYKRDWKSQMDIWIKIGLSNRFVKLNLSWSESYNFMVGAASQSLNTGYMYLKSHINENSKYHKGDLQVPQLL